MEKMYSTQLGEEEVLKGPKCQDCGNQAKKDCAYSRCRSCCKNKGFNCHTHIRSTWIPADRRRHRMDHPSDQHHLHEHKRHKQINTISSSDEFKFPAVTSSMTTLTCVQVRSMDETVNETAYQTSVEIGGHVFSGILYDQGPDEQSFNNIHPLDQQQNLNLFSSNVIHTGDDGASASATIAATASHRRLLYPPPHPLPSFRPGMPY